MALLTTGDRIGAYEIQEQIASGGMGAVYRAIHKGMNREAAIKVLHESLASDAVVIERLRREAQAIAMLRHPNIVEIYDAQLDTAPYFLAIAYASQGTLHDQMKRVLGNGGRMSQGDALAIVRQIALGLDYAHGKGIVHRDIKPSNVLITSDGTYVLTDFGIAGGDATARLTATATYIGTPLYMSPEQTQGLAVDRRSDLYSLGVLLYELLSGAPPFRGDTPVTIVYKHVHEAPPPIELARPDTPAATREMLRKLLAKRPDQRFQHASELIAAIDQATRPAPASSASATPSADKKGATADRWLLIAGAGLATLALVGLGAALMLGRPNAAAVPADIAAATAVAAPSVTQQPDATRPPPTPAATAAPAVAQASATPIPTATPTPVPKPTRAGTPYDNFDQPAFDGTFDTALWRFGGTPDAVQRNGRLLLRKSSDSTEGGPFLELLAANKNAARRGLSALVTMKRDQLGDSSHAEIKVSGTLDSGSFWFASCTLGSIPGGPNESARHGLVYSNGDGKVISSDVLPLAFETTYDIALVVDPDAGAVSCSVDGVPTDSVRFANPAVIAALNKGQFGLVIDVWGRPAAIGSYEIDDVRVLLD